MKKIVVADGLWIAAIVGILALFVVLSLVAFDAPGLYMDAVNPDFEVVKILHPDAPIVTWEMPGDLLFNRFPILLGLYAGSVAAYWDIPFYILLGGTVLSIRVAHLCLGVLVLVLVAVVSRDLTRSAWMSAAIAFLLALDPAFIYVFRTQGYVQMFGLLFLLSAILALHRTSRIGGRFAGGVLVGLAGWTYFVYLFTVPGIAVYLLRDGKFADRKKALSLFFVGLVVGVAPYFLGYGLLFGTLGFAGGVAWLHGAVTSLHVNGSEQGYLARIASIASTIDSDLSNRWQWLTFWNEAHRDFGQSAKALILILAAALGLLLIRRENASRAFEIIAFPTISFVLVATYFGARLGGHDLTAIVTLAYLCAALSLSLLRVEFPRFQRVLLISYSVLASFICIANAEATRTVAAKLARDGGVALYSRSISLYPARTLQSGDKTPVVFWSWGEMMPFIYETGGSIPIATGDQTAATVCRFGRAKVVLLGSDVLAVNPTSLARRLGLKVERVEKFGDDLTLPFETVSLVPETPSYGCSRAPAIARIAAATPSIQANSSAVAADGLRLIAVMRKKSDVMVSDPAAVPLKVDGQLPQITVRWTVTGASIVEIHMGSPTGPLFARGSSIGSATTGNWVVDGATFFLQDVSNGSPGETVAHMVALPCHRCI